MRRPVYLCVALALAGCAGNPAPPPVVADRGCNVFEPYTRETSHLDNEDYEFVSRHNAGGSVLCRKSKAWAVLRKSKG
jgi:hypothetical protein